MIEQEAQEAKSVKDEREKKKKRRKKLNRHSTTHCDLLFVYHAYANLTYSIPEASPLVQLH